MADQYKIDAAAEALTRFTARRSKSILAKSFSDLNLRHPDTSQEPPG
jgi:hypothetical protein